MKQELDYEKYADYQVFYDSKNICIIGMTKFLINSFNSERIKKINLSNKIKIEEQSKISILTLNDSNNIKDMMKLLSIFDDYSEEFNQVKFTIWPMQVVKEYNKLIISK